MAGFKKGDHIMTSNGEGKRGAPGTIFCFVGCLFASLVGYESFLGVGEMKYTLGWKQKH